MEKTVFLDLIERHLGTQLVRYQLQFFFNSSRYLAVSCPRRGGKSFITNLDALYTCTEPNKRVVIILPNQTSVEAAIRNIRRMTEALDGYVEIANTNRTTIFFNNGSTIYLLSGNAVLENYRGCRFNKVIIEEPDYIKNIEELMTTLELCTLEFPDAQLKMIGTHGVTKHNLKSYMLNPYFEKITVTAHSIYNPMSRERLNEIESTMDSDRFSLEYLNEITPSLFERLTTIN